jgi:hypothetical protein
MTPRQVGLRLRDQAISDGFVALRGMEIRTVEWKGFKGRTFAATADDGSRIILAPDMRDLEPDIVMGIMVHELGHALDYAYPAQWDVGPRGRVDFLAAQLRRSAWERRSHDTVERAADVIGEVVFGVRIGYRGCQTLQSVADGTRPRPHGLH